MLTAAENIVLPLKLAGVKLNQEWFEELIDKVGLGDRLDAPARPSSPAASSSASPSPARSSRGPAYVRRRAHRQPRLHHQRRDPRLLRDSVDTLGQTTVMVTHDAHAAAIADRVLFLADGDIVRDLGPSRRTRSSRRSRT